MLDTIKILRLKNGEDIIAYIKSEDDINYDISEPMTVDVEVRGSNAGQLIMGNWLPVQLIKQNETTLKSEDILLMMEPQDHFLEYYMNAVDKLNKILEAKRETEKMTDEEITEILNALEGMDEDRVIH
jgi:hypothetical protein